MNLSLLKYCFIYCILCCCFISCKKDSFITSPNAALSTSDTILKYDTVFTTVGSITKSFTIRNENNQRLLLTSVKVMGGATSPYKININGIAAQEAANIEIAAEDSIHVFVTVNINPSAANLPFIVKDSIQVSYNGKIKFVHLEAFGQNANFLRGQIISANTNWDNLLPYIILDSLRVDENATLTLAPGCKIYCHANTPVLVDGTLIANGTKDEPILFAGDRLDEEYKDLPASWPGIYFRETSKSNVLKFTTVKNAYQAIVAESPSSNSSPKVTLHQCIVDNAFDAGILCVNSSLDADNSLISNCGSNIYIILGGKYNFINCTVAAYSTFISHRNPVLAATNFALLTDGSTATDKLKANFTNCIFWGEQGFVENETVISKQGNDDFQVAFSNCLYRGGPANSTVIDCMPDTDPVFDSIDVSKRFFDFRLTKFDSPAINTGKDTTSFKDLDDNNHISPFDIGCYEKQ